MHTGQEIILLISRLCRQVGNQARLGKMLGVSGKTISRWKTGMFHSRDGTLHEHLIRIRELAAKLVDMPQKQGTNERMWNSMRILQRTQGRFTVMDISLTATVSQKTAKIFIHKMVGFGYVRAEAREKYLPGVFVCYRLVINSGPRTPQFRKARTVLFDPNLKQEVKRRDVA